MEHESHEQELSFEQQLALATVLFQAVDDRNLFIEEKGGFDTFAEVGQHVEGVRDAYDQMENAVSAARREFDEKISYKKEFVEQLRGAGYDTLADRIAKMFRVYES